MTTVSTDPLQLLLDSHASAARDAAIDALLADREALQRMKLALAFDRATTDFVRQAQALPASTPWFQRWQLWFGPVAAAAALYAVVGGLSRPDVQELRMAQVIEQQTLHLARSEDRISGGSFEPGSDIFRQSFD